MKGNPKIIEVLNKALTVELTAINQYFIQARIWKNWGYNKLASKQYHEALGEMKHAETIIDRVLFLEGVPAISRYDVIRVGTNVKDQLRNDLKLEMDGAKVYNEGVDLCLKLKDAVSRELMEHILVESEGHIDWLESQLGIIEQVGIENYLAEQMGETASAK